MSKRITIKVEKAYLKKLRAMMGPETKTKDVIQELFDCFEDKHRNKTKEIGFKPKEPKKEKP